MQNNSLALFNAFYKALPDLTSDGIEQDAAFSADLQHELKGLNPIAANDLLQSRLDQLKPDTALLSLYDAITAFQYSAIGELHEFEESHPFVSETVAITKRLSGKPRAGIEALPRLLADLKKALSARAKANIVEKHILANAAQLNEYRLQQLEKGAAGNSRTDSSEEPQSIGEFTHTRQAIAIHYLLQEALGITGVDTTRLMEFAHLLAAKNIPLSKETGKENIRNSGIKSAFNKAWKKEDANHLADLRFVLRFFKPLNVEGAMGVQQAVAAIEKRIAKVSEKLGRAAD